MTHKDIDAALVAIHLALRDQFADSKTPDRATTIRFAKDYGKSISTPDHIEQVVLAIDFDIMAHLLVTANSAASAASAG